MPDITMCIGNGCPRRESCYRATATPSEFRQSYFMDPNPCAEAEGSENSWPYYWANQEEKVVPYYHAVDLAAERAKDLELGGDYEDSTVVPVDTTAKLEARGILTENN